MFRSPSNRGFLSSCIDDVVCVANTQDNFRRSLASIRASTRTLTRFNPSQRALFSTGPPVGLADDNMVERADYIKTSEPLILDAKRHAVGYLSRVLNARVYDVAEEVSYT